MIKGLCGAKIQTQLGLTSGINCAVVLSPDYEIVSSFVRQVKENWATPHDVQALLYEVLRRVFMVLYTKQRSAICKANTLPIFFLRY